MNMGSRDKPPFSPSRLISSFRFAFAGLHHAIKHEKNLQVHLAAAVLAAALGIVLRISEIEWLFILLCVFGMIILEVMNAAIERTVDLLTEDYHPLAKQAKDLGAAAVLLCALFSILVGFIIFGPKLWNAMEGWI